MTVRWRDEDGITLVELLTAVSLMLVILTATVSALVSTQQNHRRSNEHSAAQEVARRSTDRLARELRNLASPSLLTSAAGAQPLAVERALAEDFIFRIVGEVRTSTSLNTTNLQRVRYCLDSRVASRGKLVRQVQTWTAATAPAMPAATTCPGAGWGLTQSVADRVVNASGPARRPVFSYNSTLTARITRVRTDLYVDPTPTRPPGETRLTSGVFLRNQNRFPIATPAVTIKNITTNDVLLNGGASIDPESMPLTYDWFLDSGATSIGQGVVLDYRIVGEGRHTVRLVVRDPAGLSAEAVQDVVV